MINTKLAIHDSVPGTKDIIHHWGLLAIQEHLLINPEYEINSNKVINFLNDEFIPHDSSSLNCSPADKVENLLEILPNVKPLIKNNLLEKNLDWIQNKFELCESELQVVTLVYLAYKDPILKSLLSEFSGMTTSQFTQLVSKLIGFSERDLKKLLQQDSKLIQMGIITVNFCDEGSFYTRVGLLDCLMDYLSLEELNYKHFSNDFQRAPSPKLNINDFPHMSDDVEDLKIFLRQACLEGLQGINILIHSQENSGKTQLVRALADDLQLSLFEICSKSLLKNNPEKPLQLILRSQQLLGNELNNLLLVDDAHHLYETLYNESIPFTNLSPTIWLTSQLDVFNVQDLYKFSYCLEIKKPSRKMREDFIKLKMEGLSFSEPWIIRTATNENISLSMLENITNFTKLVCKNNSNKFVEEVFDKALCRTSEFFKYTQNVVNVSNTENYNKDFINADIDLGTVSESLRHHSQARICLSGPPGCGKTGYAFYLARLLDKPIISKKGSDILGRYLGETEKNLAKAFNEAHSLDSILLIDEVDGLLSNRQNAQRHWEISMVNELLTQIDSFKGLLVVTTNLFNQIDPAAMRRFDLKVNFNYLNADQIGKLWDYQVNQLCLDNNFESKQEAMVLKELTPGDFATINRQSKFMPIKDAIDLMSRLKKEVSYKHNYGVGKAIGFLI